MNEFREKQAETHNADGLFDLCQKCEIPNSDLIKSQLIEGGMKTEDIETAFNLMSCIIAINDMVGFPENYQLNFNISKNPEFFSSYNQASSDKLESYSVTVDGASQSIANRIKNAMIPGEDGNPQKDFLTRNEALLKIATHEVRHRLQRRPEIKIFTTDSASSDKDIQNFGIFFKKLKKKKEQFYQDSGKSKEFIACRTDDFEFDSELIEYLVMNKIREGININDLVNIITIQPAIEDKASL